MTCKGRLNNLIKIKSFTKFSDITHKTRAMLLVGKDKPELSLYDENGKSCSSRTLWPELRPAARTLWAVGYVCRVVGCANGRVGDALQTGLWVCSLVVWYSSVVLPKNRFCRSARQPIKRNVPATTDDTSEKELFHTGLPK
jgi:hypothetical protein